MDGEPIETFRARDGSELAVLAVGTDERGDYLLMRERTRRSGRLAGPHWHPVLCETFTVRSGRLRFRRGDTWTTLGPGDTMTVAPGQVHEFRRASGQLEMLHEVRPPGQHREMFAFMFALDVTGRVSRFGVPLNPLALGVLWRLQDGYLTGIPPRVQEIVFGGLARLADRLGYRERVLAGRRGVSPGTPR